MAFVNSSMIGVDYNNASSTALFATRTGSLGSDGSRWVYVIATGTLTTGQIVSVFPNGTAYALTTALLNGGDVAGTTGYLDLAVVQTVIPQGQYGWAARDGMNLYVATTGTVTGGGNVAFAPTAGAIWNQPAAGVGASAFGIFVTTSASTATAATCIATIQGIRGITTTIPGM